MASAIANGKRSSASTSVKSPEPVPLPSTSSSSSSAIVDYQVYHPDPAPSNRYSSLIASQTILCVRSFALESGDILEDVQVAYKTWGKLNDKRDNCMIICHALTGSADVEDW